MTTIVKLSPEYFPNPTIGRPISSGSIYIGEPDLDPEIVVNQIQVSAVQEDGTSVSISQPISTSAGGVPTYNGSPVTLTVEQSYSLKVLDSSDSQIYYVANNFVQDVTEFLFLSSYSCDLAAAIADIGATVTTLTVDCDAVIASGTTVTAPLTLSLNIINGGSIDGVSGGGTETLIINGSLESGNYQIFGSSLTVEGLSFVNPMWWGAVADDATSCSIPFNSAATCLVSAGGGVMDIPTGTFYFPSGAKIDPGTGDIDFVGRGKDSVLHYHEGTDAVASSGVEHLFRNLIDTTKGQLTFRDFTIRGTLDTVTRTQRWANPMYLTYYPSVTITNMWFEDIAAEGMDYLYLDNFICTDNYFENIAAACIKARSTPNCIVTGNYILRNGDDSIALHSIDDATISRKSLVVTDNIIISGGTIKLLGGRVVNISNNQMILPNLVGIQVSTETGSTEGNLPIRDISITNNVITNPIHITSATPGVTQLGILLHSQVARGATVTHSTIPGGYDSTDAVFIYPWDYDDTNTDDTDYPVSPVSGVVISGNIIRRTLPTATNYSDYGYGTRLWQGAGLDPAITDAHLRMLTGIRFQSGTFKNVIISKNIVEHSQYGINMLAPTIDNNYDDFLITDNIFNDFLVGGVLIGSSTNTLRVDISSNLFNGDIYRENANSNNDGTYIASTVPKGIDIGDLKGIKIKDNTFRNVLRAVGTNAQDSNYIKNNTLICEVLHTASGFHNTNKGIGLIDVAGKKYNYIEIDADPTSATYGALGNVQLAESNSMPAAGTYVIGSFVKNSNPSIDGSNMIIFGWVRLTTGTGHVSGTDWAIVYGSHTSPAT